MRGLPIGYVLIIAIGFLSLVAAKGLAEENPSAVATFPIADVIAQIKTELAAAESAPGAGLGIALQKVTVNFALSQTFDANGNATVAIPVVGGVDVGGSGGRKSEQTSSLLVELAPPKGAGPAMSGHEIKNFGLTQAIISTRTELLKGLNQKPQLLPEKVVISLKFAITRTAGGTGKIKFFVFSVGGGATSTDANTSSIDLTFAKTTAP